MKRAPALGLTFIVVLGAAAIAWFALGGDRPADPDEPTPVDVASVSPTVGTIDPVRERQKSHEGWVFKEFERDLAAIRDADAKAMDEHMLSLNNQVKIYHELVDVDFKDATMAEVIQDLNEKLKYTGVNIFTVDNGDMDHVRFTLSAKDVEVGEQLISLLIGASQRQMYYYTTSQGLCLASQRGIERAQIDAREALAKKRAEGDRASPLLSTQFRPDFADAWIGPIIRAIRDQTGVEVVCDAGTWADRRTLTWRAEAMPLRDALDRMCAELHCVYRVREGRVFLMQP